MPVQSTSSATRSAQVSDLAESADRRSPRFYRTSDPDECGVGDPRTAEESMFSSCTAGSAFEVTAFQTV